VSSRIYLSGGSARDGRPRVRGSNSKRFPLDEQPAPPPRKGLLRGWTKGATALLAAIRALATHEGVEAALLEEWKRSQPELPKRSEVVTCRRARLALDRRDGGDRG